MDAQQTLTAQEARERLNRNGISAAAFAKEHGLHPRLVCAVLSGRLKCRIGKSHRAAVLLGMKNVETVDG